MERLFRHKYEFKIITSKYDSVWLKSTAKVCLFFTEMCANDLGIFVWNGGYHLEEESVLRILVPRLATKPHQRPSSFVGVVAATACTLLCADASIPAAGELQTTTSAPSDLGWTVLGINGAMTTTVVRAWS